MKKNSSQKLSKKDFHSYPWWSPRFWHGMPMRVWFDLVRQNHWKIAPSRLGLLGTISAASCFNSTAESLCKARFRRQLESPPDTGPPLFIIGHWRSGTTLLHELLMLDDRFCCPTTYQCFAPSHFLLTEAFLTTALAWIMPAKRPMDNVAAGWHRPQEDEFALVNMGAASPYRRMAFPNTMPAEPTALDLETLTAEELQQWKGHLQRFIAMLAIRDARRPILKSPTHTARMAVLAGMFPGARFLHIVRDPFVVFPSTKRLWNSLHHVQSMQIDSEKMQRNMYSSVSTQCTQRLNVTANNSNLVNCTKYIMKNLLRIPYRVWKKHTRNLVSGASIKYAPPSKNKPNQ